MKSFTETLAAHYNRKPRPPLRSLREIAAHLGVDLLTLRGKLNRSLDAPKPKLNHKSGRTQSNAWYDLKEVKAWWNETQNQSH